MGASRMHKLAVFDWNGTLLSDTVPSWKAANICLEFYGAPAISLRQYRETFHFPVIHFYRLNGCNVDDVLARKDEANTVFQSAYERLAARARTRTGARDLLTDLQRADVACIILSNYLTHRIEAQLSRLNIDPFFQYVSAHNDDGTKILEHTTKAERLSAYMVKRGYRPADTVIIGDTMEEPEIGRHLGLTSIGITDGYISRERLRKAKPDHIVHNLRDIQPVLRQKWGLPQ